MAGKCAWDGGGSLLEGIDTLIQNIDDNREGKSDTQIIQQFKEGIMKDIKNKYIIDMQELPKVAKSILDLFQDILDDDTNMISEDELLSWFQTDNKIAEQLDTLKKTDDLLGKKSEEEELKQKYENHFMQDAFGYSAKAKLLFTNFAKNIAVNSFLFADTQRTRICKNSNDLDTAIYNRQNELFKTVIDYIRSIYSQGGIITDFTLNKLVSRNNESDYAEIHRLLRGVNVDGSKAIIRLNPTSYYKVVKYFGQLFEKPSNLESLIQYTIDPNKNSTDRQKAQERIKAYNAWVLLNNFDAFANSVFGEVISIDPNIPQFKKGRYSLTSKGTKLYSTWRSTDEIFLDKEINNVTKFIITSLPKYTYNGDLVENAYLSFNDFNHFITAKLKKLMTIKPTTDDVANFDKIKDTLLLRGDGKAFEIYQHIKNVESFQDLVTLIRLNPESYTRDIFYILSDSELYKQLGLKQGTFSPTDKDTIQTINRGLYNGKGSLLEAINRDGHKSLNYLAYITQSIDSVFSADLAQYFEDQRSGTIKGQSLQDSTISNKQRQLTRSISSQNTFNLIDYPSIKDSLKLKIIQTSTPDSFNLQGTEYRLDLGNGKELYVYNSVNGNTLTYSYNDETYIGEKAKILFTKMSSEELDKVAELIQFITGKNIKSVQFTEAYTNISGKEFFDLPTCYYDMLKLTSNIVGNMAISNELMIDAEGKHFDTKSELQNKINIVYQNVADFKPGINSELHEINLIDSKSTPIMKMLATIEAYMDHLLTASQVKDGAGHGASIQNLSRLLGSYPYQFKTKNLRENSVSKHYSIFDKNLFLGVEQMKEAKTSRDYKSHVDFTAVEFEFATLVYDYLSALNPNKHANKEQILRFIPAIMSDKGFIGRMKINIDAPTKYSIVNSYSDLEITPENKQAIIDQILKNLAKSTGNSRINEEYAYESVGFNDDFEALESLGKKYFSGYDIKRELATILPKFGYTYNFTQSLQELNDSKGNSISQIIDTLGHNGIKYIIQNEIGSFYRQSYEHVQKDWNRVINAFLDPNVSTVVFGKTVQELGQILISEKPELITDGLFYQNFTFDNFNKQIDYLNKAGYIKYNPQDAVEEIVREWNYTHPNDNIKLTLNMHYENNKQANKLAGTKILSENKTSKYLRETFNDQNKLQEYFKLGEQEFFCDLLKDGFELDLLDYTTLNNHIKNVNNGWVDDASGKLILGRFTFNGTTYNITSNTQASRIAKYIMYTLKNDDYKYVNFQQFLYDLDELNQTYSIDLNERFKEFNAMHYLFSQEFVTACVGTHLAHPSKFSFRDYQNPTKLELSWEENARFNAQFKRHVSFTATMQEFQLNQLNGAPSRYNIAIIDDIEDTVSNILGDAGGKTGTVSPHDGATFVDPFLIDLENNSLGGARAGIIKKPFVHFYDETIGNGGIIKTAGFGITNASMKNMRGHRILAQNMTDRIWYDEEGNPLTDWNILSGFDTLHPGQSVDIQYSNTRESSIKGVENAKVSYAYYDESTNTIRRVIGLEYNGNNSYTMKYCTVDENNKPTSTILTDTFTGVNTNWKLFNMFGGMNSLEFNGTKFVQSEYSREAVVKAINSTGIFKDYNDPTHPNKHKTQIKTQEDVYQPLKHSDIHYVPTAGAVKQGMGNINSLDYFKKVGKLNYFQIDMSQAGIQLDKEHEADSEEISLMTQVVSACVARGYSFDKSSKMYKALAILARNAISDSVDLYEQILSNTAEATGSKEKFKRLIIEQIVDSIIHQDSKNSLIETIKNKLIEIERSNIKLSTDELNKLVPFSDGSLFNSLASQLSVDITKSAIKLKIDGVLSILCPAFSFMKIHGDKKLGQFKNEAELIEAQQKEPDMFLPSDVRIGGCYNVTYSDGSTETITIKLPGLDTYNKDGSVSEYGYMSFKKLLQEGKIVSFKNNIIEGRDLAHYNAIFEVQDGDEVKLYQLYDLASVQEAHKIKSTLDLEDPKNALLYKQTMRKVQEDLKNITYGIGSVQVINSIGDTGTIAANVKLTKPAKVESAEVVLPRLFQTAYGLEEDDELSDILEQQGQFFTDKILKRLSSKIDMKYFDAELKFNNGNHIYIAHQDKLPTDYTEDFFKKKINTYEFTVDGALDSEGNPLKELWRIDSNGNKMYKMYSKDDQVYVATTFDGKPQEVIITSNPDFYISTTKGYSNIFLSTTDEATIKRHNSYLASALNNNNKIANVLNKLITTVDEDGNIIVHNISKEFYDTYNKALYTGKLDSFTYNKDVQGKNGRIVFTKNLQAKDYALGKYLINQGNEMFSSLQKSLQLIAARIPAQSMQSFMSMKIVAFDSTNSNTAYVASTQLWLQGSDFDIDTTNFTQYSINRNGKIQHWSSLADYSSQEMLKASDNLPFPTNEECFDGELPDKELDIQSLLATNEVTGKMFINIDTPEKMKFMSKVIELVNEEGLNSLDVDTEEKELFREAINKHNKSIYGKGKKALNDATKNFMLTQMFDIIESPENQIEAQKPIDVATDMVKKIANNPNNPVVKESRSAGPRNALTVNHGIVNNQVGKKGVGIVAVGLKSFFAATNYINSVLNNPNSTLEQKQRLILGKNGQGIKIRGKIYYQFANIHQFGSSIKDPLTQKEIQDLQLKAEEAISNMDKTADPEKRKYYENLAQDYTNQIIAGCDNDEDAAIALSALLSQATDNAKELSLGKINGGTNMLGMYVYGSSIGMHFKDIAEILMSKPMRIIASMMDSNIFDNIGSKSIEDVFDYFEIGPVREINNYVAKDLNEEQRDNEDSHKVQPRRDALNIILTKLETKYNHGDRFNTKDFGEVVGRLNVGLWELIRDLDEIRVENQDNPYVQQLLDIIEDFKIKQHEVIGNDTDLYESFKNLSAGAEEFKVLGQLLHVNQGLETSMDKQIAYLQKFDLVNTRQGKIDKELNRRMNGINIQRDSFDYKQKAWDKLTIDDFIQNPENCIQQYEEVKHTLNLFDLLFNSEHYLQYVKGAWILDAKLTEISSKYRALKYWSEIMSQNLSITSAKGKANMVRGLNRMVNDYIATDWLTSPRFGVNKDQPLSIYLSTEERKSISDEKVKGPGYIKLLGSPEGKAQFKKWFERILIPNLKQGYNGKRVNNQLQVNYALKNNKFIQNLVPNVFTNTVNHNTMIAYTLPINMSPRSEEETNTFQEYKMAFNQLNSDSFGFYRTLDGQVFRLQDLFFIYNLITNYNQPGEKALTSIFADSIDYGLISDFYKFEAEFDQTQDITKENTDISYVTSFVIPVGSIWGNTAKLVWLSTGDTFDYTLWEKQSRAEAEEAADLADAAPQVTKRNYKGETYVPINVSTEKDADHIGINYSEQSLNTKIKMRDSEFKVTIKHYNGHISSISYNNGRTRSGEINFENREFKINLQFKIEKDKITGKKIFTPDLNLTNITKFIEADLNKC